MAAWEVLQTDLVQNAAHDKGVTIHPDRISYPRRVLLTGVLDRETYMAWAHSHARALPAVPPLTAAARWQHAMRDVIPGDVSGETVEDSNLVVEISVRVRRSRSV